MSLGRLSRSAIAGLWLLVSPLVAAGNKCAEANSEALAWLDKMSRSLHQVSYHGVVTFQRGNRDMQVMQVSHSVENGTIFERMTQLTGQGAQVVRVDHPLHCVHPGHKLLRLSERLDGGDCGIGEHYKFSVADGERIAGRRAVQVRITPRDMYRYGYIMELDRKTGLLLKAATVGRGEQVLEKFQFANLSYQGKMPHGEDINLVHEAEHPVPGEAARHPRGLSHNWRVGWLPRGFTATDSQPADTLRKTYTDGLAVMSVFLESLDREIRPGEGLVREGSTTSYSRGMTLSGQPVLVTVVGEVPVNTARMVADSVSWLR